MMVSRAVFAAAAALMLCAPQLGAPAQAQPASPLELAVGQGVTVALPAPAGSIVVARPEVADVQLPLPRSLFVFGKAPGRSTVQALGAGGRILANFDITVVPDIRNLRAELAGMPGARVSLVGSAILLEGEVPSPAAAARAAALAQAAAGGKADGVINQLRIAMATQVNLRVRVAEVSRSLAREIGFNFDVFGQVGGFSLGIATGRQVADASGQILRDSGGASSLGATRRTGSLDMNAIIDALEQDGLVSILVEPNLTARSGETASFLSGGEFPIPVNQNLDGIVIEFKRFGVSLDFTPTVLDGGRIALKVRPEVSELNEAASVEIRDIRVPGLSVRRAETTVELGSGQSFAIAGLLRASQSNNIRAVPFLSDIPVLGALFRSVRFQRQETELVIIVTPYIVEPAASPADLAIPNQAVIPSADLGRLLGGKLTKTGGADPAGFILE
ncbi:MAG: type II and III secretion system protein family protein [Sandarakinorhabdus sp.]|nr:type II and III secretion system protein family protein [Sandarakinorhabdus sp.]